MYGDKRRATKGFELLPVKKKAGTILTFLILAAILFTGCGVRVNVNKTIPNVEEMLANLTLIAEPVQYNSDGAYTVVFRYDKGGFKKMDLAQAYAAYYPITIQDQVETITGNNTQQTPPLPADVQKAANDATGANQLEKIGVITVLTVDDQTLQVSFTDGDNPVKGREYFFIIPNEGLAGSVIPEYQAEQ